MTDTPMADYMLADSPRTSPRSSPSSQRRLEHQPHTRTNVGSPTRQANVGSPTRQTNVGSPTIRANANEPTPMLKLPSLDDCDDCIIMLDDHGNVEPTSVRNLSDILEDDSSDHDSVRSSSSSPLPTPTLPVPTTPLPTIPTIPTTTTCSSADEPYRHIELNDSVANSQTQFCSNIVITSRFTFYNFLPKILFYEFSKLANAYFLIISIMQTIKPISNTGGFPASLPALTIIVLIDMFFAMLEDIKRHRADATANRLPCRVFNLRGKQFQATTWNAINVGDIVCVKNREPMPADLVILASFEPDPEHPAGICYVETKSLDGETNLKLRQGLEATYPMLRSEADIAGLKGTVVCEQPNNAIHRFCGTLTLETGQKEVITTTAVCLRGSTLRNTEYIYGLVVNTGKDTKIMMASSESPIKWSNMEKRLNQQILYICVLMVVLCVTGATLSTIWNAFNLSRKHDVRAWYLHDRHAVAVTAPVGNFFIQVLYYFLLLNSFIPVSLYVSMTSVKFMQSYFMNNDLEMYHEESDTPCQVRTMSLNEELGQIDYIFSDKTGTLTCNIMEFRKCSIHGVAYGLGDTEVGLAAKKRRRAEAVKHTDSASMLDDDDATKAVNQNRRVEAPFVNFQDDSMFVAMAQRDAQSICINSFFEHLAVCHTVMPERNTDGSLRLSASSPDEQALVAAAGCFGFKFMARSPGKATVERFSCIDDGRLEQPMPSVKSEYEVLEVLEFNSTRKRMSVITRGPNGEFKLLCKGADTVIYERLKPTQDPSILHVREQTLQHMENFASEGLRTLVIAETTIDKGFYESWIVRYRAAINDMKQIELRRLGEPNAIDHCMEEIEVDLEALGCTAIEDRLQCGVPDTIQRLREASIKIWVLTGDKEETAINIGFACRLLTPDLERIVISADTHPDLLTIMDELERYAAATDEVQVLKSNREPSLRVDQDELRSSTFGFRGGEMDSRRLTRLESMAITAGQIVELALVIDGETLELALEECPLLLLKVAQRCQAVIACRVSPAQKAQLVRLVRENDPAVRTLAIGDGANDVSMIQAAHVGVGISGQEGMQAANSSDYAIAQFRFLSRLLLVHGRWNYIRMGQLILYIFYKNVMMNLTQYWYMLFTGFSGQKFFLEWGLQGYNLFFTSVPIILISTLEQDVPAYYAENFPILYRVGQENLNFNTKVVWGWITSCIWESLVISYGTLFGLRNFVSNGETPQMWVYGCVAFTTVLLVVTLKLCLRQRMWWRLHIAVYAVSFLLWLAAAGFLSSNITPQALFWRGVLGAAVRAKAFWLLIPLLVFTALSRDILWKGYQRAFYPTYKHLAQEVNKYGLKHMADKLLAFPPPEEFPHVQDIEAPLPSEDVDAAKRSLWPFRPALQVQPSMSRKSVARGSAFSYDAESVMVESFLASSRYHNNPNEARPLFERHASRGSMAFRSMDSEELLALTSMDRDGRSSVSFIQPTPHDLRLSMGAISRGVSNRPHRRRRFNSASPEVSSAVASTAVAMVSASGYNTYRLTRQLSHSNRELPRSITMDDSVISSEDMGRYTMDEDWQLNMSGTPTPTPRLTPLVRRYTSASSIELDQSRALI